MLLDLNPPVGFAALVLALLATSVSIVIGVVRPQTGDIDALVGGTLVYGGIAAGVARSTSWCSPRPQPFSATGWRSGRSRCSCWCWPWRPTARCGRGSPRRCACALGRRGERYGGGVGPAGAARGVRWPDEQLPAPRSAVAEAFRASYVRVEVLGARKQGRGWQPPTASRPVPPSPSRSATGASGSAPSSCRRAASARCSRGATRPC